METNIVTVSFLLRALIFLGATSCFTLAFASDPVKTEESKGAEIEQEAQTIVVPHKLVELTTQKLMSVVAANQGAYDKDPEKYFGEVDELLEPVIDVNYIARIVMGPYWKGASAEQRKAFVHTFQRGLVETLGKGMAKFNDLKTEILPSSKAVPEFGKVVVVQKVIASDGVKRVAYTMGRRKDGGSWKIVNVVLDGVNLGTTFRSQFAQAVKEHEGNLDAAIAGWSS